MDSPQQPAISATDAPKPISRLEVVKDGVEMFSKIILGMAAAFFVCGLIVVNLYLREFGVTSFSLFRVSYITAGAWAFSPIGFAMLLLGAFSFSYFQDLLDEEPRIRPSRRKKVEKIFAAIVFAVVVLGAVLSGFGIPIGWKLLIAILIGIFVGSMVIVASFIFLRSKENSEKVPSVFLAFFCAVSFLCYLLFLAPSLYREIPASVGGGAGMPVVFVVPTDNQELVKAAGITFAEPMRTDQVTLLLQTDKEYVVLAGDPKTAITLSADLVSAIRHASTKR